MRLDDAPEPPHDRGFAVAPERIGGPPRDGGPGPDWIRAGTVVALCAAVVAVGFIGHLADGPPATAVLPPPPAFSATPRVTPAPPTTPPEPTATAVPTLPLGTPMPQLLVGDISRPPHSKVLTVSDTYRWLDLASGQFGERIASTVPIRRLPDGSYLCACVDSPWSSSTQVTTLSIDRFAADGTRLGSVSSVAFEGVRAGFSRTDVAGVAPVFAPDGRNVLAGAATRLPDARWRFDLAAVGVTSGALSSVALGEAAGQPSIRYVPAPAVNVAPDGRLVMVTASVYRGTFRDPAPVERMRWLVEFDGVRFGSVVPFVVPDPEPGEDHCDHEGFVTQEVYAVVCSARGSVLDPVSPAVLRLDLSGRALSRTVVTPAPLISANVVIDRGAGAIHAWDPAGHTLYRIDGRDGALTSTTIPAVAQAEAGVTGSPDRHFLLNVDQTFVLSPDLTRLYAIGATGGSTERAPGSTGVWVFDARSLRWLGHWDPAANYSALGISADGTELYAAGLSGVGADGRPSRTEASVTVHDTSTGVIHAVAGRLGRAFTISFVDN